MAQELATVSSQQSIWSNAFGHLSTSLVLAALLGAKVEIKTVPFASGG
jgi:hypothetical protein